MSEIPSYGGPGLQVNRSPTETQPKVSADLRPEAPESGFDFQEALDNLGGPIVEVGGPTKDGYFTDEVFPTSAQTVQDELLVSNIEKGRMIGIKNDDGSFTKKFQDYDLDFRANGLAMPFARETLGAVFSSYLPRTNPSNPNDADSEPFKFRGPLITEVFRTLEPGGLMVMQAIEDDDVQYALDQGFQIVYLGGNEDAPVGGNLLNAIFKKPVENTLAG